MNPGRCSKPCTVLYSSSVAAWSVYPLQMPNTERARERASSLADRMMRRFDKAVSNLRARGKERMGERSGGGREGVCIKTLMYRTHALPTDCAYASTTHSTNEPLHICKINTYYKHIQNKYILYTHILHT
jgi:hypothetical protein